jgi:HK97 family phage prohead protease
MSHLYARDGGALMVTKRAGGGFQPVRLREAPKNTQQAKLYHFVASDEGEDRLGDRILTSAWDLGGYKRNPVVLMSHLSNDPPVARTESIRVEGGRLLASIRFAGTQFAEGIRQLVDIGFLKGMSVGFVSKTAALAKSGKGYIHSSVELIELSLVPVPSNPRALLIGITKASGKYRDIEQEDATKEIVARLTRGVHRAPSAPVRTESERIFDMAALLARNPRHRRALEVAALRGTPFKWADLREFEDDFEDDDGWR